VSEELKPGLLAWLTEKTPAGKYLLHGVGGGAGIYLAIRAVEALEKHPEFLPQLLSGGFLSFAALVVGMVIFDRRLQGFSELQMRHVVAQEELAAGVKNLAMKDDTRAQTQEADMRYLAGEMRDSREEMKEILGVVRQIRDAGAHGGD
jgi:hypothetical protein